jgi:hypothetical protein
MMHARKKASDAQLHRQTYKTANKKHTENFSDRQTCGMAARQIDGYTDRQIEKQAGKQTKRSKDRQIDRHDRQAERQTDRHTHTQTQIFIHFKVLTCAQTEKDRLTGRQEKRQINRRKTDGGQLHLPLDRTKNADRGQVYRGDDREKRRE